MSGISVKLDMASMQHLVKRLQKIERDLNTKPRTELAKFLMVAGEELAKAIKKQSKDVMPVKTGRLRASVHSKHSPSDTFIYSDSEGMAHAGGLKESIKEGEEVVVGTNVEYAFKIDVSHGFMTKGKNDFMPIFDRELKKLAEKVVKG